MFHRLSSIVLSDPYCLSTLTSLVLQRLPGASILASRVDLVTASTLLTSLSRVFARVTVGPRCGQVLCSVSVAHQQFNFNF